MPDFDYTISVVVYNNLEFTKRCLAGVFNTCTDLDYELIVTNNASTDGTREHLNQILMADFYKKPTISIFENEENEGFIQPQIKAFQRARGRFFVTLNNDVELGPGWLQAMRAAFDKDPDLAVCGAGSGCTELGPDGVGCGKGALDYVEGSCMMVRTELQKKHGFFDNDLRAMYCDDSELCIRMRSLGYRIAEVEANVRHFGAVTTKLVKREGGLDIDGYQLRNRHILMEKWKGFFEKKRRGDIRSKVLIRRTGAQGDVLMATPALAAFRKKHPKVHVTVKTACPVVLRENPNVDEVIGYMPNLKLFDRFFDLDMAYEKRPLIHPVIAYQDELEIEVGERLYSMELYPDAAAREMARNVLPDGKLYAMIHPGSIPGWVGRQWRGNWDAVAGGLRARGYTVVRVGNDESPGIAGAIDAVNQPFQKLAAIMERANLFVGLDSMPLHVAQACRVPTVGVFGCVEPSLRFTFGNSVAVVAKNTGCLGCHNWLPGPRTVTDSCLRGDERCMKRIEPADILAGVGKLGGFP